MSESTQGPAALTAAHHEAFCWEQHPGRALACDRVAGHLGPHSWWAAQQAVKQLDASTGETRSADERGITVQELIHQLTAEYTDPAKKPIIYTTFYHDDVTPRRCVVTEVRATAGDVHIEFEPEEGAPGE